MDILIAWTLLLFSQRVDVERTVTTKYENVEQAIVREFKEDSRMARAIFKSESGLDPKASSNTGDYGICQINLRAHWGKIPGDSREQKIEWLENFQNNLKLCKKIKDSSGWYPWTDFKNGKYKVFIIEAIK